MGLSCNVVDEDSRTPDKSIPMLNSTRIVRLIVQPHRARSEVFDVSFSFRCPDGLCSTEKGIVNRTTTPGFYLLRKHLCRAANILHYHLPVISLPGSFPLHLYLRYSGLREPGVARILPRFTPQLHTLPFQASNQNSYRPPLPAIQLSLSRCQKKIRPLAITIGTVVHAYPRPTFSETSSSSLGCVMGCRYTCRILVQYNTIHR
ncbi:hypothetical protein F5146DRAFT_116127 [Armillaria mellea]|nr:hypothetical protein F5146DRAFT_116127 [Armillaria mellea]